MWAFLAFTRERGYTQRGLFKRGFKRGSEREKRTRETCPLLPAPILSLPPPPRLDFRRGSYAGEKRQPGGKNVERKSGCLQRRPRVYKEASLPHPPCGEGWGGAGRGEGKSSLTTRTSARARALSRISRAGNARPRKRRGRRAPRGVFAPGRKCEIAGDAQCAVKYTQERRLFRIFPLATLKNAKTPPEFYSASPEDADRGSAFSPSRRSSFGRLHVALIAPLLGRTLRAAPQAASRSSNMREHA